MAGAAKRGSRGPHWQGRRDGAPRVAAQPRGSAGSVQAAGQPGAEASVGATGTSAVTPARWEIVDFLRGCALIAMIAYHFCFDLAFNGWLQADFAEDWRWMWFRFPILGSFLFLAGISLALAEARGQRSARFWRRVATIGAAAALVSLGSYLVFPQSFIYFGVLHAIALMSIFTRPLLPLRGWLIALGIVVIGVGNSFSHSVFDQSSMNWIGLMTQKPRTEDYVPLFPWFGMMLIGGGMGAWLAGKRSQDILFPRWRAPRALTWMTWMGRHSLLIYLAHQPLMLGTMMMVKKL